MAVEINNPSLPLLLAGPILRHVSSDQVILWLACSQPVDIHLRCLQGETCLVSQTWQSGHKHHLRLGEQAHIHLLQVQPETPLPMDEWISYDIGLQPADGTIQWLQQTAPQLFYEDVPLPSFVIKSRIDHLLHGSCRNPHHDGGEGADGLLIVDKLLKEARGRTPSLSKQPALLLMTGDQIYADDVAGPMLHAIHQTIDLLGLGDEPLQGATIPDSQGLRKSKNNYYGRTRLLPDIKANARLRDRFFGGVRKPVFTSANADNHLITLAEFTAMYLLIWSPVLWEFIDLEKTDLEEKHQKQYQDERKAITLFSRELTRVRRALANVPIYMMFDDHDVTDDWNLTRGWEESAYSHPFSRRIIGQRPDRVQPVPGMGQQV